MHITPVILCGGAGTRLWPLSREQFPKQFQTLYDNKSLFQHTVLRALQVSHIQSPLILCNHEHRFIIAEQLREINAPHDTQILLEPKGRNTAPAIIMASLYLQNKAEFLWVMPSDHYLQYDATLEAAVHSATQQAQDYMVTFGIKPTHAETAYGYIEAGSALTENAFSIQAFTEKPNAALAEILFKKENYFWNSGMFLFKPQRLQQEAKQYAADIWTGCENILPHIQHEKDFAWLPEAFVNIPADSIDYAIMEKTQKACIVPLQSTWYDLGSWNSLGEVLGVDQQNNCFTGDIIAHDVNNSTIYAQHRLVAAMGLDEHVVIETPDSVLVLNKKYSQDVKTIVAKLSALKRSEVMSHQKVYRPWGWYESISKAAGFQVKRISVKPQAALSLQMHQHRSEHWVVVKGEAQVTCDDKTFILKANQSTFIPSGCKHRLANMTEMPLELIEVQSGSYLGEDDIIRFEDHYGRNKPISVTI